MLGPFALSHTWRGTLDDEAYPREATLRVNGKPSLDAADGTSDNQWNPEELLGASLAQCHMLTFLALAKKVRLDVRAYAADVTVEMAEGEKSLRVGRIALSARITVAPGTDAAKTDTMFHKAHKYCFIANSITAEVVLQAEIVEA